MNALPLVIALVTLVGCKTAWERHDESLYSVMKNPSAATAEAHSKVIHSIIKNAQARDARPPAGLSAEYAYYLAKLGRRDEAKAYLDLEARHYPEAKTFLAVLERFLEGVTPLGGNDTGAKR